MKHIRYIVVMVALLAAGMSGVMAQHEVYDRYAVRDGLDVAYIRGYRLDSTATVDVVLIIAKDSAAWQWMQKEFRIKALTEQSRAMLQNGENVQVFELRDREDPTRSQKNTFLDNCLMRVSALDKCVGLYYYADNETLKRIIHYLYNRLQ